MSRALLVEGTAAVALDGTSVGRLSGAGDALALDVPGLGAALRVARAARGTESRADALRRLASVSRQTGIGFEMRVRGRTIARVRGGEARTLQLSPLAMLRSVFPG